MSRENPDQMTNRSGHFRHWTAALLFHIGEDARIAKRISIYKKKLKYIFGHSLNVNKIQMFIKNIINRK